MKAIYRFGGKHLVINNNKKKDNKKGSKTKQKTKTKTVNR
jgi:hypothetical protein